MVKELKSLQENTLVYELSEFINQFDIKEIENGIGAKLKDFDKINLMIDVHIKSENFASFFKELEVGIKYWNKINKIAFIGESKIWETVVKIDNIFTKFKEKYFEIDDLENAWKWLNE